MKQPKMTSNKPYLLRAFYDWILDNNMVPHIVIDANAQNVKVPLQYVQEGRIVLNISPTAALQLDIHNDYIAFNARFSGSLISVYAPMKAILAIYARETGAGMVFDPVEEENGDDETPPPTPPKPKGRPNLTLVKSDK